MFRWLQPRTDSTNAGLVGDFIFYVGTILNDSVWLCNILGAGFKPIRTVGHLINKQGVGDLQTKWPCYRNPTDVPGWISSRPDRHVGSSFRLNQPKSVGSCYFLSRERFSRCRAARLAGWNIDVSTHWAKIRKASFQGIIWCLLHISLTFLKMFRSMHEIPGTLQLDFQGVCSLPQTSKDVYFFVFKHGLLETRLFSPSTFPFKCPFSSVNSQLVMFDDARG